MRSRVGRCGHVTMQLRIREGGGELVGGRERSVHTGRPMACCQGPGGGGGEGGEDESLGGAGQGHEEKNGELHCKCIICACRFDGGT